MTAVYRPRLRRTVVGLAGATALAALLTALVVLAVDDDGAPPSSTTSTAPATTAAVEGAPGAAGVGDPYFPGLGNGGYDVRHYDLRLDWDPGEDPALEGVVTVRATATQDLSSFNLDLAGLEATTARVDDAPASLRAEGRELIVTPASPIPEGHAFSATITYAGNPQPIEEGTELFELGWHTDGREAYVVSEPSGAATFFPVNDHPTDKATYRLEIEAPGDLTVAANGLLAGDPGPGVDPGDLVWTYEMPDPMASYLVQVAIGDYELVDAGTFGDVRIRHALHRRFLEAARATVADTATMLDVLDDVWGPYPFDAYGVVTVDEPLGFALETQSLTIVGSDIGTAGSGAEEILVHELAHQWVGDAVSPATWKDIWLNEGMATYSEWLWNERVHGEPAAVRARGRFPADVERPPGDPGSQELFGATVYQRGALTLQALREAVGDDAFFRILRTWIDEHSGGVASTADFVALSERVSGQDLDALFQRWLFAPGLPSLDG